MPRRAPTAPYTHQPPTNPALPRAALPPPGVTDLTTFLSPDGANNAGKARALSNALPLLSRLHAHFGARSDAAALLPFFSAVKGMARLRDLRVTSWVPYAPQKGVTPLGCFGTLALGPELSSLAVDGAPFNASDMVVSGPGLQGAGDGCACCHLA